MVDYALHNEGYWRPKEEGYRELLDFVQLLIDTLPEVTLPEGFRVGSTGYWCSAQLNKSQCPRFGKTKDQHGRGVYFLDEFMLCERGKNNRLVAHLLNGDWCKDSTDIWKGDIRVLNKRLETYLRRKSWPLPIQKAEDCFARFKYCHQSTFGRPWRPMGLSAITHKGSPSPWFIAILLSVFAVTLGAPHGYFIADLTAVNLSMLIVTFLVFMVIVITKRTMSITS